MMVKFLMILFFTGYSAIGVSGRISSYDRIKYYGKEVYLIEGNTIPQSLKESPFDRLPFSYKEKVRPAVWDLSKASSGLSVRFLSNTSTIYLKWELLNNKSMNHMAETGIKGLDLYCKIGNDWQYINTARPEGKKNEFLMVTNMTKEMREYKIFLPLYDGLEQLKIGIDSLSLIYKPDRSVQKPIVFYGTSITQGGCASRPGMAYSNIISRKLNIECVNYGFSGNGRMEKPIVELISGIDALFYVIDCTPNMSIDEVKSNTIPLVEILRRKRPNTPIIFIENLMYEKSFFDTVLRNELMNKNAALKQEYKKLLRKGATNIFYIESGEAIGNDHEATVDGIHFTDLGFMRFADFLISKFEQLKLTKAKF